MSESLRRAVVASLFAIVAVGSAACNGGGDGLSVAPPAIVAAPQLALSANPRAPLAANMQFSTDRPITSATLETFDGVNRWETEYRVQGSDHDLPVRGLHPAKSHTFTLTVAGFGGSTTITLGDVLTPPPLPPDFPVLDISLHDGTRLEPGFTLFVPISSRPYVVAVDNFGEVAWYLALDQARAIDLQLLDNGNLVFVQEECRIVEIDFEGEVVNAWATRTAGMRGCVEEIPGSIPLDIESAHHEVFEMPSGNLLTLSRGERLVAGYPNSDRVDSGSSEQIVIEDIVVEFARDGTIVRELHLADILDPVRIGYDSVGNINDWAHGNAIVYDERDDSFIFSGRHQDAVVKFAREDGALRWILGTPGGWLEPWFSRVLIPLNFAEHSWHQHAPEVTPDGTIMLFDNGNYRARPYAQKLPATQNYSRAVEYAIDEATLQVTQVWEYGSPATVASPDYAPFLGDADVLPQTGNVLITFGGITRDEGVPTDQLAEVARNARIVEVTRDVVPEKLLEIYCGTADYADAVDCIVYRAEHIESLVPAFR